MKLVTRAEWGARPPKRRSVGNLNDTSTCHWNGPKVTVGGQATWDHSKCASLVRGIQNFHMDSRGWSDIAYNFLECPHGYSFEGRGLNVINAANGTNVGNQTSHAIMCLGGEDNAFLESEKVGFRECVMYVANSTTAPEGCIGHRDHHSTACPGDERYAWVHQGMPVQTPVPTIPVIKRKDVSMEAALILVKILYDNKRGGGKGTYDVAVSDRKGWQAWVTALLDAHDKGTPLKAVTDLLAKQLAASG